MMTFEDFEKMLSREPAKITATCDENANAHIECDGRGLELMALSMQIAEDVMKYTHTDVDSYCEMLKEGINMHKTMSKETMTKENEEIKKAVSKILEDLFG